MVDVDKRSPIIMADINCKGGRVFAFATLPRTLEL